MEKKQYELTETTASFLEGDVFDVTARYGYRHTDEMRLELHSFRPESKSIVVTRTPTGFSEREVLDPTSRFGDWHTETLTFEAGASPVTDVDAAGPVQITVEELNDVTVPVSESA